MKTKEIEVWVRNVLPEVYDEFVTKDSFFRDDIYLFEPKDNHNCLKARLIIELPEKSVTITESEFDNAWGDCIGLMVGQFDRRELKQKLFGEKS